MIGDDSKPQESCPICHLNWLSAEHDKVCTEPDCKKEKGMTFDDWIDGVADHIKGVVEQLPPQ